MKALTNSVVVLSAKFGSKIRIITFVLTLILFVIAAGAPQATGGIGG
jgi:hypothetical protein